MSFCQKWRRMQLRTGWPFGPWVTLIWAVGMPIAFIGLGCLYQWYLDL